MNFSISIEGASLLGGKSCLNPKYFVTIRKDARHLATVHLISAQASQEGLLL